MARRKRAKLELIQVKKKTSYPSKPQQESNPVEVSPDTMSDRDAPGPSQMATDDVPIYNVPVTNRFSILPIPVPQATSASVQQIKRRTPPPFHVFEPASTIRAMLPKDIKVVIRNGSNCTDILVNDHKDHEALDLLFRTKLNWKYHTHPIQTNELKKFVLNGLTSFEATEIKRDLISYGLHPVSITKINPKQPRYNDQATYFVYFQKDSGVTLPILQQARYICDTVARWSHYESNGDGVIICSRCSTPGHMMKFCNRPPRCKMCANEHLTNDCPLIAAKRASNNSSVDARYLKCPLCSGPHTAGYRLCPQRLQYKSQKAIKRERNNHYINAQAPAINPWHQNRQAHFPELPQRNNDKAAQQPQYNQQQYTRQPQPNNRYRTNSQQHQTINQHQPDAFNADELMDIFLQMIDIASNYSNKADQLRALSSIITNHI